MSHLEKKLMKILEQTPINEHELKRFLQKQINHRIFHKKNKKEIIKLFPILFSNTNINNRSWLELLWALNETPGFLDSYITNFSKIQYEGDTFLFQSIFSNFELYNFTEEQTLLLIDKILECNLILNFDELTPIYKIIVRDYPHLKPIMLEKYIKNKNTCNAAIRLLKFDYDNIQILYNNIDFVVENINKEELFDLVDCVKENPEACRKVKDYIEKNPKENVFLLIKRLYNRFCSYNSLEKEEQDKLKTILEVTYLIMKDICKNENINISDIRVIGGGTYSTVLEIGEKVIKIGNKRVTPKFPNNPYVNAILLRKEFPINEDESFFVEVNEKLDLKTNASKEELYQLYKKIRDIGLVWSDVSERNVGRLKKDNIIHWREELPITEERLGLENYRGMETLKKGELVILDNDIIYEENTPLETINKWKSSYRESFENRYQQEKAEKNKNFTYMNNNQQDHEEENIEITSHSKLSK